MQQERLSFCELQESNKTLTSGTIRFSNEHMVARKSGRERLTRLLCFVEPFGIVALHVVDTSKIHTECCSGLMVRTKRIGRSLESFFQKLLGFIELSTVTEEPGKIIFSNENFEM